MEPFKSGSKKHFFDFQVKQVYFLDKWRYPKNRMITTVHESAIEIARDNAKYLIRRSMDLKWETLEMECCVSWPPAEQPKLCSYKAHACVWLCVCACMRTGMRVCALVSMAFKPVCACLPAYVGIHVFVLISVGNRLGSV